MSNGNAAPLVTRALYSPPKASLSLNVPADVLIRHAQDLERFAATESSLTETGGRERFWRAATALCAVAVLVNDDAGFFAEVCACVDNQRVRS